VKNQLPMRLIFAAGLSGQRRVLLFKPIGRGGKASRLVAACPPIRAGWGEAGGGRFRKLAAAAAAKSVMNSSPKVLCFCYPSLPLLKFLLFLMGLGQRLVLVQVGAGGGWCGGGGSGAETGKLSSARRLVLLRLVLLRLVCRFIPHYPP